LQALAKEPGPRAMTSTCIRQGSTSSNLFFPRGGGANRRRALLKEGTERDPAGKAGLGLPNLTRREELFYRIRRSRVRGRGDTPEKA